MYRGTADQNCKTTDKIICRSLSHSPSIIFPDPRFFFFFFFNATATTEIYTLSLHDALPISIGRPMKPAPSPRNSDGGHLAWGKAADHVRRAADRKSTRLNSSHPSISYA